MSGTTVSLEGPDVAALLSAIEHLDAAHALLNGRWPASIAVKDVRVDVARELGNHLARLATKTSR